jgi:Tol biopolymer transport system component
MNETRDLLERVGERFAFPDEAFDRLLRRRDRKRRNQRIAAGATAFAIFVMVIWVLTTGGPFDRSSRPAGDPTRTPTPNEIVQRRDGEFLMHTGDALMEVPGDLVAVDPQTGETRVVVDDRFADRIGNAAWSANGRWLAFDIRGCVPDVPNAGLWVSDALGAERRLTELECRAMSGDELWAWSPTTAQLAVERSSADGESLILIDAATGNVVDLGPLDGDLNTLSWSPDGTQITYNTNPSGSVYSIDVEDGTTLVLSEGLGYVYGIGGSGIHWSPDGDHVAIAVNAEAGPSRLYLMDPDGSGLRDIDDHVQDVAWSPVGTRIAFATFTGSRQQRVLRIWTIAPQDATPTLVHEEASFTIYETADLAWSPDGTRIAFTTDMADGQIVHLVIDADGTGDARDIDEALHLSWRGGWYFCECYG